ncbi:cupin domain-containing protein [Methylomonas rapida]|uniref:Cupin domain-containing protein n=1 Tax=Methylomonas rapida TaxID=2963939 RepID=A0ABY7GNF6_9GAMM|nr:cupin domain-containing protein [Methylomonas rapida]WAR46042.1 cupin domain-containing protein [Methylomonas rapida]
MTESTFPIAAVADQVPPRARKSLYPQAILDLHGARLEGREKRPLGDLFGLQNFGVNLTKLEPGAISALRHAHAKQDEFIYILQGCPTLYTDTGSTPLSPGMCAGFKAGSGDAHRLVNETERDVLCLEIGDRTLGDQVIYPDEDLQASFVDNIFRFTHKDGTPY